MLGVAIPRPGFSLSLARRGVGDCMALSDAAVREVAKVLSAHVEPEALEQIAADLVEIRGDKDFRDTIQRLVHALRMVADR